MMYDNMDACNWVLKQDMIKLVKEYENIIFEEFLLSEEWIELI